MTRAVRRLQGVKDLRADGFVPNSIYCEQAVFDAEVDEMLPRVWHLILHESEVPETGDYRTAELAGRSIVIVRDADGRVRGYRNVCRHRGHPIVTHVAGKVKRFQCPYHLWTFDIGGSLVHPGDPDTLPSGGDLKSVAQASGYNGTGFCKDDFPLEEIEVDLALGFVFARLERSGESLQDFLGPVLQHPQVQLLFSQPLETFHFHRHVLKTNWKLFVDNNREGYHVNLHYLVRKTSPSLLSSDSDGFRWESFENGHSLAADPRGAEGVRRMEYQKIGYDAADDFKVSNPLPGLSPGGLLILHLFPDVMINVRSNAMRVDRMVPLGPGRTVVEWRGLGLAADSDDVRAARIANHNLIWTPFGRNLPEDITAVEYQWKALSEGGAEASEWGIIARDWNRAFTDDVSVRDFYTEWRERMDRTSYPYKSIAPEVAT